MRKGMLIVVSGPSGTGKGTVCSELLAKTPELAYSISATTRAPRDGEVDGKNYYFLTKEKFEQLIGEGGFLEHANVYGNYYGTPLKKIEERRAAGQDSLLEIDIQGALNVMAGAPPARPRFRDGGEPRAAHGKREERDRHRQALSVRRRERHRRARRRHDPGYHHGRALPCRPQSISF